MPLRSNHPDAGLVDYGDSGVRQHVAAFSAASAAVGATYAPWSVTVTTSTSMRAARTVIVRMLGPSMCGGKEIPQPPDD